MNPLIASTVLEIIRLGTALWRRHANMPDGWEPTDADWRELEALAGKSADDYKREALQLTDPQ